MALKGFAHASNRHELLLNENVDHDMRQIYALLALIP